VLSMEAFFQKAAEVKSRAKVLQSFVSNFPKLAFNQNGWLWDLLGKLQSEQSRESKLLLRAIARGISEPEKKQKKYYRQQRIEKAKKTLSEWKQPYIKRSNDLISTLERIQGAPRYDQEDRVSRAAMEKSERANIEDCLLGLECPLSATAVFKALRSKGPRKNTPHYCRRNIRRQGHRSRY